MIVCFVAVHMINQLIRGQRSAKVDGHIETMLHNRDISVLHFPKHGEMLRRDSRGTDDHVPVIVNRLSASVFALLCLKCTFAGCLLAARFALTVVVRAKNLLAQGAKWIPALYAAMRARNFCGRHPVSVHMLEDDVGSVDRWVLRKVVKVWWACHGVSFVKHQSMGIIS